MKNNERINLENLNNKSNLRDYDKEPLIIKNNFITIMYGFTFVFLIDIFLIYIVFFAGVIDWSSGEFFDILKNEMRNPRFSYIVVAFPVINIWALIDFIRKLKKPEKVYLYNDRVYWDKKNITIKKDYLKNIQKSIYTTLYLHKNSFKNSVAFVTVIPFLIIVNFTIFLFKTIMKIFNQNIIISLFCNIVFFSNDNKVINIYLITKKDYDKLNEYLSQNFNLQIENLDKSLNYIKLQGENHGRK